MTEDYRNGFREIYAEYTNDNIRSLLSQGEPAFDDEAWELLLEEAKKRSIAVPDHTDNGLSASPSEIRKKPSSLKTLLRRLFKRS